MKDDTDVHSNTIQYSDETFIFCSEKTISESKLHLERSIAKLFLFFKKNLSNENESKPEFIIIGDPKTNKIEEIVVYGCTVLEKKIWSTWEFISTVIFLTMKKQKCAKKIDCWHK